MNMDFVIKVLLLVFPWHISARVLSTSRQARLSLAEPMPSFYYNNIDGHPGTYSFGYDVSDPSSGNTQFRNEERYPNGTVVGSYGYLDPYGRPQRYRYVADHKGYRVMRDRPSTYPLPASDNPSSSGMEQENEVTWTRKKPNGAVKNSFTKPKLENRNFLKYPLRYYNY